VTEVGEWRPEAEPVGPAGFLRGLLERGERRPVPLPLTRQPAPGGSPRLQWMAEAVRKDALGWLFRRGGWRKRLVVAGGRRREGRVSDAGIWERLDVRFSALPLQLAVAAAEDGALALPVVPAALEAAARAGTVPAGDVLALHRLVTSLIAASGVEGAARALPEGEARAAVDGLRKDLQCDVWIVQRDGRQAAAALPATPADVAERLRGLDLPALAGRGAQAMPAPASGGVATNLWVVEVPATTALAVARTPHEARRTANDPWHRAGVGERLARLGRLLAAAPAAARARALEGRRRALVAASPLSLALHLEELGEQARDHATGDAPDGLAPAITRLQPLLAGDRAILATYLDRTLWRAWLEEDALRRRLPAPEQRARWSAAGRGLEAWVCACRTRPDGLRPVMGFLRAYLHQHGNRAPVVEALRLAARAFDRASERDAYLLAASRLFAAGRSVSAVAMRVLDTPIVERTEEEKVFLGEWHETFRGPLEGELEAIRRELAGEVG
jgi:hypothetical protein